jgi:hypothetical protein
MSTANPRSIKYVYLDVVGFTKDRSVEAQTDIVETLNTIVRSSAEASSLPADKIIFLPTGDGMGIALLDESAPFDSHLTLALEILRRINVYSGHADDSTRRFSVRIGVEQNVDNLVVDINGARNVAGAGINQAQRVMSLAGDSQILVSQTVFAMLSQRERYMKSFRRYDASIKHGFPITVYQFLASDRIGLSTEVPPQFVKPMDAVRRLNRFEAYYLAHAQAHRPFLLHNRGHGQNGYALIIVLWYLALDSVTAEERKEHESSTVRIYGKGRLPLEDIYAYYKAIDFSIIQDLAVFMMGKLGFLMDLTEFSPYPGLLFLKEGTLERVRQDQPDIFVAFNFGQQ